MDRIKDYTDIQYNRYEDWQLIRTTSKFILDKLESVCYDGFTINNLEGVHMTVKGARHTLEHIDMLIKRINIFDNDFCTAAEEFEDKCDTAKIPVEVTSLLHDDCDFLIDCIDYLNGYKLVLLKAIDSAEINL